jgi:hypothetical protein
MLNLGLAITEVIIGSIRSAVAGHVNLNNLNTQWDREDNVHYARNLRDYEGEGLVPVGHVRYQFQEFLLRSQITSNLVSHVLAFMNVLIFSRF